MNSNWGVNSDRWDAALMKFFAADQGDAPWFVVGPRRRKTMAFWGLSPQDLAEDARENWEDWRTEEPDGYEAPWE